MNDITVKKFYQNKARYVLLDVREPEELEIARIFPSLPIPMQEIPFKLAYLNKETLYVVICHSGQRSKRVVDFLIAKGYKALNLIGGIDQYSLEIDPSIPRY